ncbi:MAG: Error-prone repair protein ImuA [Chitinophagaceae bacterium]|nr:MAG: Error-prone repair protein ImuA [Chitinophagaceae bacterium]
MPTATPHITPAKAEILARLQKEILPLQGLGSAVHASSVDLSLGPISASLPNGQLATGAVHEFISHTREDQSAGIGFMSTLMAPLMRETGTGLWISNNRKLFPPALKFYGIDPDRWIFIDVTSQKDIAWAIDESLKCAAVSVVVGELPDLAFAASRRLQLSVEKSQVTAFLQRYQPKFLNTTACVTRWKVKALPGEIMDDLPGVGTAQWEVELLKVRNGRPGKWQVGWMEDRLFFTDTQHLEPEEIILKSA